MPADYRGTIRHAGPWVQMCARDMPHLDIHYYARDDLDLLLDFDRACLETGAPISINGLVIGKMMNIAERAGARALYLSAGPADDVVRLGLPRPRHPGGLIVVDAAPVLAPGDTFRPEIYVRALD